MSDVFVSYSRRDTDFVTRLADDLRQRGKDVWVDVEGIRDAEVFPQALRRAIEGSDAFVFVISPDSVASQFCEQEVARAAELNKRIVPLALREVPDEAIPGEIRFRNWIPVAPEGDTGIERVVSAIETDFEWERQHTRLTVKALEWDESGRDGSFLLRGSDLATAEQWLAEGAGRDPGPTELEQEYLLAARQAASRRQRALLGGSVTVAVVALGLLIFALISRGQAVTAKTNAQAQALAAVSATQQTVDPERAVLLGMAAVRTKPTYGPLGTMFALRSALDVSTIRYALPRRAPQECGGPGVSYDPAPGSNLVAEGLCNGQIVFANATTGRPERTVQTGQGAGSVLLLYTADGSALVAAAGRRLVELDPTTGAFRAQSPIVPGLSTFAVDPKAPIVAALGRAELDFWNLATGKMTAVRPNAQQRRAISLPTWIAFSPDARRVALAFGNNAGTNTAGLVIVDLAKRRFVGSLATTCSTVAFSPDGRTLAVGEQTASGGAIAFRDARTLKPERTVINVADVTPTAVAYNRDGTLLAYGFADGTAGLASVATARTVESYPGDSAVITAVSFSPDGQLVATGSADGTVRAWRVGGLALRTVATGGAAAFVATDPGGFVSLDSPGAPSGEGVVVRRWRDDGRPAAAPLVLSRTANVNATFLGPQGRLAVVNFQGAPTSNIGRAVIWNVAQRRILRSVPLQLPTGHEPVMSPDGNLIAMNVAAAQSPTGSPIQTFHLEVLNLRTGSQRVLASTTCNIGWAAFSFNATSSELAAGTFCGGQISVWNPLTGRRLGPSLNLDGGQLSWTAFRPDGRQLAVAGWNGPVKVSPIPLAPKRTVTLPENSKGVPMVAYSPNGRYLASAGLDHTVRIFDAHTLAELRVIPQPLATNLVAFTPDSRDVVSEGADGVVRLWDACTYCENARALLALARTRVTRSLTAAERQEFGVG